LVVQLMPSMGRRRLAALALLLLAFGIGLWAYQRLHDSVLELRADNLQSLLEAEINALDLWVGELQHDALRIARRPEIVARVQSLLQTPNNADRAALLKLLTAEDNGSGADGVHVIDKRGVILASRFGHYAGLQLTPEVRARLAPVFSNRPTFIRPYHENERVMQLDAPSRFPLLWVEAPVQDRRGNAIAALGFGYRADQEFTRLFKAAWPGRTGEIFSFDSNARLLSASRHAAPARRDGASGGTDSGTALSLYLRVPDPEAADASLTTLAHAALAGRHATDKQGGVLLEPYRSYTGRDVIGAWRWLPAYDMGIAIEMEAAETYAPLRYLNIGIAGVLVVMLLVAASLFVRRETLLRWFPAAARRVGPYQLIYQIGEGAISDVFLARHKYLKRPAALKILKLSASTDEWRARFEREVQLASRLNHPNTIAIYDYGLAGGGSFYYAMEYADGLSLAELVDHYGPIPAARTAHLLRQVCSSLAQAHAQNIIHRDIKPQNIMVCRGAGDIVKVLDFGLVKQLDGDETRDLTRALRILGTPLYMSPERIRDARAADARADIYSVGAVGFFLLTGRRLFETDNDHDLTYQILHVPAPRPSAFAQQAVPAALEELLRSCLAKDPRERPASAQEVITVLDRVLAADVWTREQSETWWQAVPPRTGFKPDSRSTTTGGSSAAPKNPLTVS
jgi:eukaryotic-like serine/threonine-protein kinase